MGPLKNVELLKQYVTWKNLRVPLCLRVGGASAFRPPTSLVTELKRKNHNLQERMTKFGLDEMHPPVLRKPPNAFVKSFSIFTERWWLYVEMRQILHPPLRQKGKTREWQAIKSKSWKDCGGGPHDSCVQAPEGQGRTRNSQHSLVWTNHT